MGIAANQQRRFLDFLAQLRPHLARDSALPRRIKELLGRDRAIGSRDRRLYRELIYTALRFLPWVQPLLDPEPAIAARVVAFLAPDLAATKAYRAELLDDWTPAPDRADLRTRASMLAGYLARELDPQALLPGWFRPHCPAAFESPHLDALNERAALWIRLQCTNRGIVFDEFRARDWAAVLPGEPPDAVCLPSDVDVTGTDAYRRGFLEIQDLGSQLVLLHAPVQPGQRWLDACAGAGGKTLQLARLVGDSGHVDAVDIRPEILDELRDRTLRARLANVRITNIPGDGYDGVLVDAPCSGTGTWRRQPHLKWYLRPEMPGEFARDQQLILRLNAARVRPGGLLVYATCSLSHVENHDVVAAFLQQHPEFAPEKPAQDWGAVPDADGFGDTLLPGTRNTDGFYVARLRRHA